jgi:hypothetical protein
MIKNFKKTEIQVSTYREQLAELSCGLKLKSIIIRINPTDHSREAFKLEDPKTYQSKHCQYN